ncbi:Transcriptional regulator MntR [Candidatus Protochlamydia amoebophila]|uniref:iron dependent repressor, metal binding and dimerization domain protein n=1 Tax=Candidatus Protochlamydia amoebophila TaxID=362787 RepID=UPI001BCA30A6|nr:iron dependent repressor, metal binding and dimerization domain protein [Candidatus Protochlamydia amoebophila]MBS4163398.1 Transcriptional regulator MntR [Candidatus Protochlamydia amoebophila]
MRKEKCDRAKLFAATREHHIAETAEDYVEMILDIISLKGEARICDIAKQMGVSHVTVIRTVKRLEKKGYLITKQHQPIMLTDKGANLASFSKKRHLFLLEYLMALGVPESIAEIDVEGIEHHISQVTIEAFQKHLEFLKNAGKPLNAHDSAGSISNNSKHQPKSIACDSPDLRDT